MPEAAGTLVVVPEALDADDHDAKVLPLGDIFRWGVREAIPVPGWPAAHS